MKRKITPRILILISAILFWVSPAAGQGLRPVNTSQAENAQKAGPTRDRADLLQELGLTPEQLEEMRRINQERRPAEIAARQRFQDATRTLNIAIYSESVDEVGFESSLKEFQAAQADLARIKFTRELAIRKILNTEQLLKFRELRRRFAEERGNGRSRFQPLRRMRRGARQIPN